MTFPPPPQRWHTINDNVMGGVSRGKFGVLDTHRDGTRFTYVTDPSGNTVEILADDGEDEDQKDG